MSRQLHQSILEERHAEKTKNDLITGYPMICGRR